MQVTYLSVLLFDSQMEVSYPWQIIGCVSQFVVVSGEQSLRRDPLCRNSIIARAIDNPIRETEKLGELYGSRLTLGLRIESRIPLLEVVSELFMGKSR